MNNNDDELGNGLSEQNIFPDALAEPERELLNAVFFGAPFVPRLARALGGEWRARTGTDSAG